MLPAETFLTILTELQDEVSPLDAAEKRIASQLDSLVDALREHRPERVVELSRLACLPWSVGGRVKPETEGGLAKAELLTLLSLASSEASSDGSASDELPNSLYESAHEWAGAAESLIYLTQARQMIEAQLGTPNDLESIAISARSREVWVRNTSYPDMVRTTHDLLFGSEPIRSALVNLVGFDADQAIEVLTALHDLQVDAFNERMRLWMIRMKAAADSGTKDPRSEIALQARDALNMAWQPTADNVAYSVTKIAARASMDEAVVDAVLTHFTVSVNGQTAREVLDNFVSGDNPLRTNPVIRTHRGEFLLVHDALSQPAIRENLEQVLKSSSSWDVYQKRRGDVLEEIGKHAFQKMLPGGTTHFAFDYFVPANPQEEAGPPAAYTKRVEGDLLVILDDVAVIVEAKAVALTPAARSGDTRRLRRNLVGIITNAAAQASRLKARIELDGGVRFQTAGWVDLAHIREIHTVALSLEDLAGVATATTDLIEAKLLNASEVPWVVSIHDLQIIVEIVDRPAEFLLYLRRRRNPETSRIYYAPDELDLFLFFFEKGLYVEPDPTLAKPPFRGPNGPRTADLRRRARQHPTIILSRTDPLDDWHAAKIDPSKPPAPKPSRAGSPMNAMADELQKRGVRCWLSIGATLISGSTKTQADWSRVPRKVLADMPPTSWTVPYGTSIEDAWLLVWTTLSAGTDPEDGRSEIAEYMKAKKYQLGFRRGAAFIYDETTKQLDAVLYDGDIPVPDPAMDELVKSLLPIEKLSSPPPPRRYQPKRHKKKRR
jgi:hypothetical protein